MSSFRRFLAPNPADRSSSAEPADQLLMNLSRLEKHARYALRHIPCCDIQSDLIAETVALAWKLFLSLVRRGKDPTTFFTSLARKRHGFTVGGLDDQPRNGDALAERWPRTPRARSPTGRVPDRLPALAKRLRREKGTGAGCLDGG
jgi:hypothetical protein